MSRENLHVILHVVYSHINTWFLYISHEYLNVYVFFCMGEEMTLQVKSVFRNPIQQKNIPINTIHTKIHGLVLNNKHVIRG